MGGYRVMSGRLSLEVSLLALVCLWSQIYQDGVNVRAIELNDPARNARQLELSTARYRDLLASDRWSIRNLLQDVNQTSTEKTAVHEDPSASEENVSRLESMSEEQSTLREKEKNSEQQEMQKAGTENSTDIEAQSKEKGKLEQEVPTAAEDSDRVSKPEQESPKITDSPEVVRGDDEAKVGELKIFNVTEELGIQEPYVLGPKITDWDQQRARWLEANPHMKSRDGKPRVLIATGSQPWPCSSPQGDFFHVRALKLKIDYARMHNYEIYYNFAWLDPLFGSYWVKLPTVRKIMLTHPEIDWILWVDSDAMFTDMLFEPPFQSYDQEGYNMVMWSWKHGFYKLKSWVAVNAGVFIMRNCQWSLDLLDKWSPMGPEGPVRTAYGKMLSEYLPDRYADCPADDQSALIYLMLTDEAVMSKIRLVENSYIISGYWVDIVNTFERSMAKFHPGMGDRRWPWITHFTGCSPCSQGNNDLYSYNECMGNFTRAYSFADNQVLAYMGYEHKSLSSPEIIQVRNETDRPLEILEVSPWAERIAQVKAELAGSGSNTAS